MGTHLVDVCPATNWAGNVVFGAAVHRPSSLGQLQDLVAAGDRVRVLGTGHSFNRIADTSHTLVSVRGLPERLDLDRANRTVTVSGGMRYGDVAARLHAEGYALHNLGSLPHISVAGACATGTHGSGDRNGTLASAVAAVEMVDANGERVRLARGEPDFAGAVVSLGALGVVTSLTLDVVPAFEVHQTVYDDLPLAQLGAHFDEIFGAAYSVSVFTNWCRYAQVWVKARTDEQEHPPSRWLGAVRADEQRHPSPDMPPANCTPQLGVPGPWHERLPHFRLGFTPSSGGELQSEYFLPRAAASAAFEAVHRLREKIGPVLRISEIRTVAAEDLWLSPSQGRDTVAIHFTWKPDLPAVTPVVAAVEDALAPFGVRPHWGKVFQLRTVGDRYDRSADFIRLLRRRDAGGKFRNDYIDRCFPV